MPFELAKLKDRADCSRYLRNRLWRQPASVNAENAHITHQNELNKAERESRFQEIQQNRLAAKLSRAKEG